MSVETPEALRGADPGSGPLQVLVVEASRADPLLIERALDSHRHHFVFEHVTHLTGALERLARGGVDLILVDPTLSDSTGRETVEALVSGAPDTSLVVLTGVADEELATRALRAGAQDYLVQGDLEGSLLARALRYAVERKRSETELEASRQRLQALFDHALDAIFLADDDGRYVDANPAAEALTGYRREELLELSVADLTLPSDSEHSEVLWSSFVTEGEQRGEYRIRRKDGSVATVDYRAVADIQPGLHLSFLVDVTERREAKTALRESEERYRRFFEEDLTGDCIATPGGEIVTCNQAFADIFGFDSIQEAVGAGLPDLIPDEVSRRDFLRNLARDGKLERFEGVGQRRSGEPVHLLANVVGTFDEAGELREFRTYLFDDTERRQAEQQLRQAQKMEAVGRLAGGIAHDFNNLITAINGYSDLLLLRLPDGAPESKELREIRRAGDRAAALTRQLLAFSRSQMMQRAVLDLNEVVGGTEGMLRRLLGEDVRLVTRLSSQAGRVEADRGLLEQVIVNLAVNARDAMPRGGELVIETTHVELDGGCRHHDVQVEPGRYALLAVTDTGEGMEPAVLERVFEPFFTTKEPGRGTGLGLSTAYGIVKQSGGYIFGSSEPGEGTSFEVYLPRIESATERPEPAEPVRRGARARGETVLVVEDEEPVRRLIGQILETRGYSVLLAADGGEALSLCRGGRRIDLVISDVVMPDMRGPDLGRRIAAILPGTRVLYTSGYPGQAIALRGELPDGSPFLQKPFTQEALTNAVRDLLD